MFGMTLHGVEEISLRETDQLDTGTYTRTLMIKTSAGKISLALFSADFLKLKVLMEE